jgi:probable rRNA maturation factor
VAPRTMILLDPDLDTQPPRGLRPVRRGSGLHPTPKPPSVKRRSAGASRKAATPATVPSVRTLSRYLGRAQAAVHLLGRVAVLLTTDKAIRRLNRQFRALDKPTDVLSFPAYALVQDKDKNAGDLAISVPTARRQAIACGHSLSTELKVLILHGLLHLAGYNHETDTGQMARRERRLRAQLGLPQGLIERAVSEPVLKKVRPTTKKWVPQVSILRPGKARTSTRQVGPTAGGLKGHGFSRAVKSAKRIPALAAEGTRTARAALKSRAEVQRS